MNNAALRNYWLFNEDGSSRDGQLSCDLQVREMPQVLNVGGYCHCSFLPTRARWQDSSVGATTCIDGQEKSSWHYAARFPQTVSF